MRRFILFLIINTLFIFTKAQDNTCHCKYYNFSEGTLEDKLTGIEILNEQVKMPDGELYSQWSSGDVILNNGQEEKRFHMNRSYYGLYVCPMTWRELDNFSSGSVCLVLASELFSDDDYIRDYNEFKKLKI